jgi:hypothetical protein
MWPGTGKPGDPIFDNFIRTQVQFAGESTNMAVPAGVALLVMIGTAGHHVHPLARGRCRLRGDRASAEAVHAMVAIEPGGPQFGGVNTATVVAGPRNANSWGLTTTPYEYNAGGNQPGGSRRLPRRKTGTPGRGAVLASERAGAEAHAVEGHQGAQCLG